MTITRVKLKDLDRLASLFDAYRIFYNQESHLTNAKHFIKQRLIQKDSIIYMAYLDDKAVGFTQLYPLFSSVSMTTMYLLNDLYVDAKYINQGIGKALINRAKHLCQAESNKGLAIQTAQDNPAQHLYEQLGFIKDADLHFFWSTQSKTL